MSADVSVIIPTFQHGRTIRACIQSLLNQTLLPKEIIVIDDGSTDHTCDIVERFGSHVQYRYQKNHGAPIARNVGAAQAHGTFLLFCDADVIAYPQMLSRMREALRIHPHVSYAYSAFRWGWKRFPAKPFDATLLRSQNFINTNSLIRKQDFSGFDPSLRRFQDWDLWLTLLEQGHEGVAIGNELFRVQWTPFRHGISTWIPSLFYRMPWKKMGWISRIISDYEKAKEVIVRKHHL